MDSVRRMLFYVLGGLIPSAAVIGALFYQIKKVDILTLNTEAELTLGRLARERAEREHEEEAAPPAAAPSAPVADSQPS